MGKVNLTKRIRLNGGYRFCPVVESANGKIKADWVIVNADDKSNPPIEEKHPEGAYYIEWREHGKRIRESVGISPTDAAKRQLRKEAELRARANGLEIAADPGEVPEEDKRRKLADAVKDYLEDIKLTKKPKTYSAYHTALVYFQESCSKTFLEEIERKDMLRFSAFLRDEKEQAPRSCHNKFENVLTFLKTCEIGKLVKATDWPDYVEEEPEIYEPDELGKFFAKCDADSLDLFTFFLGTGFREQEVAYVTWPDVNFRLGTVSVTWKPKLGWTPKAYKEREVPIPDTLLELLSKRPRNDKTSLVFPNSEDNPQRRNMLRRCKNIAEAAGFDPESWWLHKFRATFATMHLQAGRDVRTVQKWLGHKDLSSTMRYLRPARNADVRDKVNDTFAFCIK